MKKRKQAEHVISFYEKKHLSSSPLSNLELKRREILWKHMSLLNKRGTCAKSEGEK